MKDFFSTYSDEDNMGELHFGGLPQRCIKLPELMEELIAGNQPPLLSVDNLNQVGSLDLYCLENIWINKLINKLFLLICSKHP